MHEKPFLIPIIGKLLEGFYKLIPDGRDYRQQKASSYLLKVEDTFLLSVVYISAPYL